MKYFYRVSVCLWFTIFVFSAVSTSAQTNAKGNNFNPYWEISLNGGFTQFFGDLWNGKLLPSQNELNTWRFAEGITLGKQFSPSFGLRTQAIIGELAGENRILNANFLTDYYEFNVHSVFNLSNLLNQRKVDRKINVYAILGYGLTNYKTTKYSYSKVNILEQKGNGEGNGLNGMVLESNILGGLGINIQFGKNLGLTLETGNRLLFTDGIDIVDNKRKTDIYNYSSIGLQYRFGRPARKPQVNENAIELKPVIKEVIDDNPIADKTELKKETIVDQLVTKPIVPEKEIEVKENQYKEPIKEKEQAAKTMPMNYEPQYRVQIRACLRCQLSIKELAHQFNLASNLIKEDQFGQYYIYTYGSYPNYETAKEVRDRLRQSNKITDAFIVAFSNGKRLKELPK